MKSQSCDLRLTLTAFLATLMATGSGQSSFAQEAPAPAQRRPAVDAEDAPETVLRGPLHEAYAELIQSDPTPGVVIPKQPPEPIDEIPPVAKPADENVVWISGYWAWDDERDDFLWVSGTWRVPPPDRRWVPGHWADAEGGFQWVSGFWASAQEEEIAYLPPPPESLEEGPTSDPPAEDSYWVSGSWEYQGDGYSWRPGYWGNYRAGWVWLPAHYVWTPRGFIFVNGYWDYPLVSRGQIFAPVYFHSTFYRRPGYFYSPSVAVNVGNLMIHLFIHPGHRHYYWGDYYGNRYQQAGFVFWSDPGFRYGYDPLFAYYQTHYRHQGINYAQRLRGWHDHYHQNENRRPARTWKAQAQLAAQVDADAEVKHSLLGQSVDELISDRETGNRFRRLQEQERRSFAQTNTELRELAKQRVEIEARKPTPSDARQPGADEAPSRQPAAKLRLPQTRRLTPPGSTRQPPAKSPRIREDGPARQTPSPRESVREHEIPDVAPGAQPESPREARPGTRPGRQPDVRPERQPETRPERRPGTRPERRPEARPERRPGPPPGRQTEVPNPREDRTRKDVPPRDVNPETPRRNPNVEPPRTPQPKVDPPQTPQQPNVDPPERPDLPKVEPPRTPGRPDSEPPQTPRLPIPRRPL